MKGQDILLLYKLVCLEQAERRMVAAHEFSEIYRRNAYSIRNISDKIGVGKSEVSNALRRCHTAQLLTISLSTQLPKVNTRALEEFSVYGLKYVFPVTLGGVCRGMETGITAPIFEGVLHTGGGHPPVWSDPQGSTMGVQILPIYHTVPSASKKDPDLYKYMSLIDSLRMGKAREIKLASEMLSKLLRGDL